MTSFLGKGITHPLRRLNGDIVSAEDEELVNSCVRQVIGTRQGELRWRRAFGSKLQLLRFASNNDVLQDVAATYIEDALTAWEPRILIRSVTTKRVDSSAGRDRALLIMVEYNIITANVPGNQVVFPKNLVANVELPL